MYRSLLVPLDGSTFAEHALPLALGIARRAGATLRVARVHVPFTSMYADSMSPFAYEAEAAVMGQERAYLDGVVKRLAAVWPAPVQSALLEGPAVAEVLNGHATRNGVDLIVMTTHGRGPLTRFWLGSVADKLVRRAAVPLLLVRPHEGVPDLAQEPVLRHVLIPLDGSELAEQVLEPAMTLGTLMQADYSLLRVYGPLIETQLDPFSYGAVGGFEPPPDELKAAAQTYLEQVAERLRAKGLHVRTHAVFGQRAAVAILQEAQALGVDLIALESHGRGGLDRLLLGSVADKVVRGATLAVLVQRPHGE
jgi:nucleotide-binding universal stress UspA family protein